MRRAVLVALLALGAGLRFWQLTTLPPGYWYDEAHKSLIALEIARGQQAPLYVTEGGEVEAGYFWLLAGWFKLFGPSYFGTRALSALLGTGTLLATWWATRTLFRPTGERHAEWIALGSAGLLSVLLWHVHWSRLGLETILVPLFSVTLLGLVAWAWQTRSGWAFALAGAALGLSQYTNPGARILPLQIIITFLILGSGAWRQRFMFGLAVVGAALVAYAPLSLYFIQHPESFLGRLTFVTTNARAAGLPYVLDSAWKTLLSLNVRGDQMARHNLTGRPALDPVASVWMVIGLGALVRRWREWRAGLAVLACLVVNLLPMVFSDGAPGFGRTLGAVPFVAILPALGAVAALERLGNKVWVSLVLAMSVVASAGLNIYDYFVVYPRQPGLFDSFEVGLWTLNRAALDAGRSGVGYMVLDEASAQHPMTRLTRELGGPNVRIVNGQACLAFPERTQTATIFAVLEEWVEPMQARLPGVQVFDVMHEPEPYRYGGLLTAEAGQPSVVEGEVPLATFDGRYSLLEFEAPTSAQAGETVTIAMRWRAERPGATAYTVFIHLVTEDEPFWGGADAVPCEGWYPTDAWHEGEVVEYNTLLSLPADLPPQMYSLAVGMYDSVTGERLQLDGPGAGEPDRAFVADLVVQ